MDLDVHETWSSLIRRQGDGFLNRTLAQTPPGSGAPEWRCCLKSPCISGSLKKFLKG